MLNCTEYFIFPIKLRKTGFEANDKWRQVPGFDLLHHILPVGHILIETAL